MHIQSNWLGVEVSDLDLQAGDLFVFERGAVSHLAMKAESGDANWAVILRTFGAPDTDPLPRRVYFEVIVVHQQVRRLDGGALVAEPLDLRPDANFARPAPVAANGSLLIHESTRLSILLVNGSERVRYDLASGLLIPLGTPGVQIDAWRLMWRCGDEAIELFRCPASAE